MLRLIAALAVFTFAASAANAATLVHPSGATKTPVFGKKTERGVSVWRGAAPAAAATASSKPSARAEPCEMTISVRLDGYPPRRLRTDGFWSGREGASLSFSPATRGFYADRMRAGL